MVWYRYGHVHCIPKLKMKNGNFSKKLNFDSDDYCTSYEQRCDYRILIKTIGACAKVKVIEQ